MKHFLSMLLFTALLSLPLYAQQKDTVTVPSDFGVGEGSLNTAVQSAIDAGKLSTTVFKLEPYGLYILTGTITTPQGQMLEIVGPTPGNTQETAPPQIKWTSSGGITTNFIFDCGGDVKMKNIWILYANTGGAQVSCSFQIEDDPNANTSGKGEVVEFENVIFDYSMVPPNSSGAVGISATHFKGTFRNCYFRNCIDTHYRYYGRALSFPYNTTGYHTDSVLFENCTFANMGYVYMQEGGEYGDDVRFNHCTFLNIVQFSLETGWWNKLAVTNSLFVNTYMFGSIPSQDTSDSFGGTISIDSIANFTFSVPFTEQERRVLFSNNSYKIQDWLVDWMKNNPYSKKKHQQRLDDEIPVPQPMLAKHTLVFFDSVDTATENKLFPYMNKANLYDGVDPEFVNAPTNIDSLKDFLLHKWDDNADVNWSFNPDKDLNQIWPIEENLSYTNSTLMTAGMGGFPLGDLYRWWPDKYAQWQAQASTENATIQDQLMNGLTSVKEQPGIIPTQYTLGQNYPNPFNPTTNIDYSVPKDGFVSLKVYNILGQEVATIFQGFQKTGSYKADFDASKLSSGVYMYRLQSENISITKKFVLLK